MSIENCCVGKKCTLTACCTKKRQTSTSSGLVYLVLTLRDKTGSIEARLWNANQDDITRWQVGEIYEITGVVNLYNKSLQMKIIIYNKLDKSQINEADFLPKAPINLDHAFEKINEIIKDLKNKTYHKIMTAIFAKYGEKFRNWPAAVRVHHATRGGLMWHSYSMLRQAQSLIKIYNQDPCWIDEELLFCGVILHDLGKILEIRSLIVSDFSFKGKLLGHISIMNGELQSIATEQGIDSEDKHLILLQHTILASHGRLEFGSPVAPRLAEAEIIASIDHLDARLFQVKQELMKIDQWSETPRILTCDGHSYIRHTKTKHPLGSDD